MSFGFEVLGLGFRVWGLGGLGLRVWGLGFRVLGFGVRVGLLFGFVFRDCFPGSGFRVRVCLSGLPFRSTARNIEHQVIELFTPETLNQSLLLFVSPSGKLLTSRLTGMVFHARGRHK